VKTIYSARHKRLRDLLSQERRRAGLTQVELSRAPRRPQSFVSKIETGERRLDLIELLEILSRLGVDPIRFLRTLLKDH
jgi:transcriptional regulator with XRE-family HTH domain